MVFLDEGRVDERGNQVIELVREWHGASRRVFCGRVGYQMLRSSSGKSGL